MTTTTTVSTDARAQLAAGLNEAGCLLDELRLEAAMLVEVDGDQWATLAADLARVARRCHAAAGRAALDVVLDGAGAR